jgi:hypothetical protein
MGENTDLKGDTKWSPGWVNNDSFHALVARSDGINDDDFHVLVARLDGRLDTKERDLHLHND